MRSRHRLSLNAVRQPPALTHQLSMGSIFRSALINRRVRIELQAEQKGSDVKLEKGEVLFSESGTRPEQSTSHFTSFTGCCFRKW